MEQEKNYTIKFRINFARFGEAKDFLQNSSNSYKFGLKFSQINREKNFNNSLTSSLVNLNDSLMYFKDDNIIFENVSIEKDSLLICFLLVKEDIVNTNNNNITQLKPITLNLKSFVINKEKEELFTMPGKSFASVKYFVSEAKDKFINLNNNNIEKIKVQIEEEKISQNSTKDTFSTNNNKNNSNVMNFSIKNIPKRKETGGNTNGKNGFGENFRKVAGSGIGNNNNNYADGNIINNCNELNKSYNEKHYSNKLITSLNISEKLGGGEISMKNMGENTNNNSNITNSNITNMKTSVGVPNNFNNSQLFSPQKTKKSKKSSFMSQTPNMFPKTKDKCISLTGNINLNNINDNNQNKSIEVIHYQDINLFNSSNNSNNINSPQIVNTNYDTFCIGIFISGLKSPLKVSSIISNSEGMTAPCGHLACSIFPSLEPEILHTYINKKADLHQELTNLVANMCFPLGIKPCFECVFDNKNKNKISNLQNPQKTFYNVIKNEKNEIFYIATMQYFLKMTIDEFNSKYKLNPITYYLNKIKETGNNNANPNNNINNIKTKDKKFKNNMQMINKLLKNTIVFIPESISLLSKHPFFLPMNLCLKCMLSLQSEEMNNLINHLINEIPIPQKYQQIHFFIPKMNIPIILNHNLNQYIEDMDNKEKDKEKNKNQNINKSPKNEKLTVSQINSKIILEKISPENILMIFQLILLEQKILFIEKDYQILSEITYIFLNLIYPLCWISPFLPVLSLKTVGCLQSPVPYIMGLDEFLLKYADESNNIYLSDEMLVFNITLDQFINSITRKHVHKKDIFHDYKIPPLPDKISEFMLKEIKKLKKINDKKIKKKEKLREEKNKEKEKENKDKDNNKKDIDINNYNNENEGNDDLLTDEELDKEIRMVFLKAMIMLIGDYNNFFFETEDDTPLFNKEAFIGSHKSKDMKNFLSQFVKTQIFEQFLLNENQQNKHKIYKNNKKNINNKNSNCSSLTSYSTQIEEENRINNDINCSSYEIVDTSFFRKMISKNQNLLNAEEVRKRAFSSSKRSSSKSKKNLPKTIPRNKNIHPIHPSSSIGSSSGMDKNINNNHFMNININMNNIDINNNMNNFHGNIHGNDFFSEDRNINNYVRPGSHKNLKNSKDEFKRKDSNDLNNGQLNPVNNINNMGKIVLFKESGKNNIFNNNNSLNNKGNNSLDYNYGMKKSNIMNFNSMLNNNINNQNASASIEVNFKNNKTYNISMNENTNISNSYINSSYKNLTASRNHIKKFLLFPFFLPENNRIASKKDVEKLVNEYFIKKNIRVQTKDEVHIFIITKKRGYTFHNIIQNKIYLINCFPNLDLNKAKSHLTEKVLLDEKSRNSESLIINSNNNKNNLVNSSDGRGNKIVSKFDLKENNNFDNIQNISQSNNSLLKVNRINLNEDNRNNNNQPNNSKNNIKNNIKNDSDNFNDADISLIKECFRTCCRGKERLKSTQFDLLSKTFLKESNKRFFASLLVPNTKIRFQKNHKQLSVSSFEDLQKMISVCLTFLSSNEYDTCRLLTIACCVYYKIENKETTIEYLYKNFTQGIFTCQLWLSDDFWVEFFKIEYNEEFALEKKKMEILERNESSDSFLMGFDGGEGEMGEGGNLVMVKSKKDIALEVAVFIGKIMIDFGLDQNRIVNFFRTKVGLTNYVDQYSEVNAIINQIIILVSNI